MSLGFWVMWYAWNVPVSEDDGVKKRDSVVVQLARKLTERLSQKLKAEDKVKCVEDVDSSRGGSPPRKASRVTWGKSTAYHNEGYDDHLDPPSVEKTVDTEEKEQTTSRRPFHSTTMAQGNYSILFLSLAAIFDIVGCILFFLGIFAPLSYWDFFVLSGPLLIFLSLVFWIFWYMGNLTVSEEELNLPKHDIL
ncbi:hypothetical protein Q5P01_016889 [Channa striata]|uniref:Transmembrane protein 238 n=1 Tax=Channa striata TaxID=64152 RepID=A0AA88SC89_CHASR|nr:hypothetical protein Q5P01_016889 [Channa striata]